MTGPRIKPDQEVLQPRSYRFRNDDNVLLKKLSVTHGKPQWQIFGEALRLWVAAHGSESDG